jgi:hypothetical protein
MSCHAEDKRESNHSDWTDQDRPQFSLKKVPHWWYKETILSGKIRISVCRWETSSVWRPTRKFHANDGQRAEFRALRGGYGRPRSSPSESSYKRIYHHWFTRDFIHGECAIVTARYSTQTFVCFHQALPPTSRLPPTAKTILWSWRAQTNLPS